MLIGNNYASKRHAMLIILFVKNNSTLEYASRSRAMLIGNNYASRSHAMLIVLFVKNKLRFVNEVISRLSKGDHNLLHVWIINNNMVILFILNSILMEISASIILSDLAIYIYCLT